MKKNKSTKECEEVLKTIAILNIVVREDLAQEMKSEQTRKR